MVRFLAAAVVFHALLGFATLLIGRRWLTRAGTRHGPLWAARLFADGVLFLTAALVLAVGCGLVARPPVFSILRFLAQALFGEGVLLAAWIVWTHARAARELPRLRPRACAPAVVLALLLATYADAYHHEPHDLHVRGHLVDLSGGRAGAGTLRILHLSDIQTCEIASYEERVLRTAAEQRVDLVVWTGDYVQPRLTPTRADTTARFNRLVRRIALRPTLGTYAVEGDVDRDWPAVFAGSGVHCLDDSTARIPLPGGRVLAVVGLTNHTSLGRDPEAVRRVLDSAGTADVQLVLGHHPDYVRAIAADGKLLALAGHTHGGQVVVPGLGPLFTASGLPPRYAAGLHLFDGIPLHVSRGIGMERLTAPQLRFGCPPEICVIDIRY